jgi:hypothetical protein
VCPATLLVLAPAVLVQVIVCLIDVSQAFTAALNCADMELVTWVAYVVGTSHSPSSVAPLLSPIAQLCLLQQLSQQLEVHTLLKVAWLEALSHALKRDDPVVAPHAPGVLAGVTVRCVCRLMAPPRFMECLSAGEGKPGRFDRNGDDCSGLGDAVAIVGQLGMKHGLCVVPSLCVLHTNRGQFHCHYTTMRARWFHSVSVQKWLGKAVVSRPTRSFPATAT